jgi:hypothetical protein
MAMYTVKSMSGSSFPPDLPKLHRSTNALVQDMLELELLIPACEKISIAAVSQGRFRNVIVI